MTTKKQLRKQYRPITPSASETCSPLSFNQGVEATLDKILNSEELYVLVRDKEIVKFHSTEQIRTKATKFIPLSEL